MRKSQREKLAERGREAQPQVKLDLDGLLERLLGGPLNPTQKAFIYDPFRIKGYKGPAGCAKTSTLVAGGLIRALLQPGSKGLIARHDYNDLMDTTALRAEEMLSRMPPGILLDRNKSPPMKWWIRPAVPVLDAEGNATGEEPQACEITFMGLKSGMGSYEFNWAILDEADEIDEQMVHLVNTRLRNAGGNYFLGLAFNPPDKHHWLYTACTGKDYQDRNIAKPWVKLFEPQSRENIKNLPKDYYDQLAKSLPADLRQRLVEGDWGSTFSGQPVFREFSYNIHVKDINPDKDLPLFRFWDFGYRRPACIWTQMDFEGRLLVLREVLGENEEVIPFTRRVKALTAQWFPNVEIAGDYGDPAVAQKKDTGQTLALLLGEGITMQFRASKIEEGTRAIRHGLEQLIRGEPAVQFARVGVPILISAMRGGYHLDKLGQKAEKDGYYDHVADAFRYGFINLFGTSGTPLYSRASRFSGMFNTGVPDSLEYNPALDTQQVDVAEE